MNKKYVVVEPPTKQIICTSPARPKLAPAEVAEALGAVPAPAAAHVGGPKGPVSLFAVRHELFRRLQSTGGRPGLSDADKVAKIPVSEAQWKRLEELAAAVAAEGFSPSAGQVANVLLTFALDTIGPDAVKKLAQEKPPG